MKLIFATNNIHKVGEIRNALNNEFEIVSLKEAGINRDIPEPHDTLEANATEKSMTIYHLTRQNCFSEDTGLEVDALNGLPGVISARYAGENVSFTQNVEKLLAEMQGKQDRKARFRTVISLIINGEETTFEGICEGTITNQPQGNNGFGYDPVFAPVGEVRTFGQMSMEEKQKYSQRKKAVDQLIQFLKEAKS